MKQQLLLMALFASPTTLSLAGVIVKAAASSAVRSSPARSSAPVSNANSSRTRKVEKAEPVKRYWVGGGSSIAWDAVGPTNWGTTSGKKDNASIPRINDSVIYDENSPLGVTTVPPRYIRTHDSYVPRNGQERRNVWRPSWWSGGAR